MHIRPGLSLDLAISGECDLLGYWEEQWLKDCLSRYSSEEPIDSLEKLHDVRARMNSEGPRWWREPGNGGIVWMPSGTDQETAGTGPARSGLERAASSGTDPETAPETAGTGQARAGLERAGTEREPSLHRAGTEPSGTEPMQADALKPI